MFLLLVIGGCGAWCAHQHWMRLDKEASWWRRSFWSWAVRGFAFPLLAWALANFGFGHRFPPLVPRLADAQIAHQPWVASWVGVCVAGGLLILTWWSAITYGWILLVMYQQARHKAEFLFNIGLFGLLSGACGSALIYLNGPTYVGAAIVLALLPTVYMTLDLAEEPPARPVYDRAVGQMKFGKYKDAEWELIHQLEKREDDFQGWIMVAELYAVQHRSIEDAARTILELCQHPSTQPAQISVACHKLADWQMDIAGNPEGARAALELLCRKLPDTHFARMAQQRMAQLPRSAEEFELSRKPKRIQMPALTDEADSETSLKPRPRSIATAEVDRLVQKLTADPNDIPSRERLATVLAVDLGKVELGTEQLELLLGIPETTDEKRAAWLAQIAQWEIDLNRNEIRYEARLREIIQKFPQTAHAFAAQRRLLLLEQSHPVPALRTN